MDSVAALGGSASGAAAGVLERLGDVYNDDTMDNSDDVKVAVVGGSGDGKSTMINELLGHKLLPALSGNACSAVPVTLHGARATFLSTVAPSYEVVVNHCSREQWFDDVQYLIHMIEEEEGFGRAKAELVQLYQRYGLEHAQTQQALEHLQAGADIKTMKNMGCSPYYTALDAFLLSEAAWPKAATLWGATKDFTFTSTKDAAEFLWHVSSSGRRAKGVKVPVAECSFDWRIVREVHVYIASCAMLDGRLSIIDVPGCNDRSPLRNRVHERCLQEADHVIVTISANRAGTDSNADYFFNKMAGQLLREGRVDDAVLSVVITKVQSSSLIAVFDTPLGVCRAWTINLFVPVRTSVQVDLMDAEEHGVDDPKELASWIVAEMCQRIVDCFGETGSSVSVFATSKGGGRCYDGVRAALSSVERELWRRKNERGWLAISEALTYVRWVAAPNTKMFLTSDQLGEQLAAVRSCMDALDTPSPCALAREIDTTVSSLKHATWEDIVRMHHQTLRAVCKRGGNWGFKLNEQKVDFNEYIGEKLMTKDTNRAWAEYFVDAPKATTADVLERFMAALRQHLDKSVPFPVHTVKRLEQEMKTLYKQITARQQAVSRGVAGMVGEVMGPTYLAATSQVRGVGSKSRMLAVLLPSLPDAVQAVGSMLLRHIADIGNELAKRQVLVDRVLADLRQSLTALASTDMTETSEVMKLLAPYSNVPHCSGAVVVCRYAASEPPLKRSRA
ncbi:hypothetical protein JKP88DRAFT_272928 [Tribonema minus]|uniref:Dynamin N-terminal domain-containing protein n=1 Tax=Tribonema minus TaxID=303371 RepID=A0A835YZP4_9STRA|nr:hypothetical protein JKP88DRAFT_272928 [Tribonema minus]